MIGEHGDKGVHTLLVRLGDADLKFGVSPRPIANCEIKFWIEQIRIKPALEQSQNPMLQGAGHGGRVNDAGSVGLFPYPRGYSSALLGMSSLLGILIPPSITMILFAVATQQSVAACFAATLVPGAMLMVGLMQCGTLLSLTLLVASAPRSCRTADRFPNRHEHR